MSGLSILFLVIFLSALIIVLVPKYRLKMVLARPFPNEYSRVLRKNIPFYSKMPTHLQMQLKRRIKQFLHQKKFIGCDDFEITKEVKVTIAGKACLLILNRETDVFAKLDTILVYPSAFIVPRAHVALGGVVTHTNQTLSGESWSDGRVVLAWDHVLSHRTRIELGHDVVVHEFAHQLDSESGATNGTPILMNAPAYRMWSSVLEKEYLDLQRAAQFGQATLIDQYGATNPAEFFAVVTELFFYRAQEMATSHPTLFEQFVAYYQVDPREWV
jgi:Mlc titration factor MtfA (ptsG expression regulator)